MTVGSGDARASAAFPPVVVSLVGPTAVGKSAVAIELAQALGAEVVNADAFQVYRGMDIGTAKVPVHQRAGVPHHLLDILDVTDDLSVAAFQAVGRAVLAELGRVQRPAIVVGGSGLYVRALLDDLRFPGTDPSIRRRIEARLDLEGAAALHAELGERDPAAAAAILPSNGRRIVRALEVIELTGQPFAAELPRSGPTLVPHVSIGLDVPPDVLDDRIERRVVEMFDAGLVEEVRALLPQGIRAGRTASRALGYSQVLALLDGDLTREGAVADTILATRRFARRQRRWFARDPRTVWLSADDPSSTASRILDRLGGLPRTLGA